MPTRLWHTHTGDTVTIVANDQGEKIMQPSHHSCDICSHEYAPYAPADEVLVEAPGTIFPAYTNAGLYYRTVSCFVTCDTRGSPAV